MHVENALVEFVTAGEPKYAEVIEEDEEEVIEEDEEVFVHEKALEPPTTDIANNPPVQGKPQYITLILNNHCICMRCAFTLQESYYN